VLSDYLVVHQVHPVEKNAFLRHSQEIFISRQITGHLLIPGYRPGAIGAIMVIEQNDPVALFSIYKVMCRILHIEQGIQNLVSCPVTGCQAIDLDSLLQERTMNQKVAIRYSVSFKQQVVEELESGQLY